MNAEKLIANILSILIAVAAISALAQLSIALPEKLSVAPITGQSLAVLVAAHILKWKKASISILLYLFLGAIGLPVFSNFSSGVDVLFGKSAGYMLGFLIASIVVGIMATKQKEKFPYYFIQMAVGTLTILLFGGIALLRFLDIGEVLSLGIKPFLAGGFVKILLGSILLSVYRRFRFLMNFDKANANP